MNLILFDQAELNGPLLRSDPRAAHIIEVLRRTSGDTVDVGLVNGPHGKATVVSITAETLTLDFRWASAPPPAEPLTLVVGLPRPQTARDILRDATTIGVAAVHFVRTEKSEASYAQSTLWSSGEWRRHVLTGAAQAFDTRIPEVTHGRALGETLALLDPNVTRIALDNYEATLPLADWPLSSNQPIVVAIGGERGWSSAERDLLRSHCFGLVSLGSRVLRTETAVIASVAIVRARVGW